MPFPPRQSERRVGGEQTSGEGCSNGRPVTLTESGRFRFCGPLTPSAERAAHAFGALVILWFSLVLVSSLPTPSPLAPVPAP